MNTAAHDAVNIPKAHSGGPKTEQGKSKSSRNAIRTGLYAARDFVRPGEEEEYAQSLIKLMDELTPDGTLEETFATEIMGATWRLRRCRLVEEAFGMVDDLDFDPMMDERTEKQQKSVDRARAQSHLILRRSIGELAKLQKARFLCEQSQENAQPAPGPAPASASTPAGFDALMALADKQLAQRYRESGLSSFCNPAPAAPSGDSSFCKTTVAQVSDLPSSGKADSSFCKTTPSAPATTAPKHSSPGLIPTEPCSQKKTSGQTPRNAPCPCGSGVKHKRCCGGAAAPPVLSPRGARNGMHPTVKPVLKKAA